MKTPITVILALAITWITFQPSSALADEQENREKAAKALLEKGLAAGALPEGLSIRISSCLGDPDVKPKNEEEVDERKESWEFSSNQVHRIEFEYKKDKSINHRVESHPIDTKDLCKELLEGKLIEIHAKKGTGPEVAFAGSGYGRGSRSLEVVWKGETILELMETNGAAHQLYRETDALAFGKLYEKLATLARASFKVKAGEKK